MLFLWIARCASAAQAAARGCIGPREPAAGVPAAAALAPPGVLPAVASTSTGVPSAATPALTGAPRAADASEAPGPEGAGRRGGSHGASGRARLGRPLAHLPPNWPPPPWADRACTDAERAGLASVRVRGSTVPRGYPVSPRNRGAHAGERLARRLRLLRWLTRQLFDDDTVWVRIRVERAGCLRTVHRVRNSTCVYRA